MSDQDGDLVDLVRARVDGTAVGEKKVRRGITAAMNGAAQSTDEHAVWWNGRTWSRADAWSSEARQCVHSLDASLDDQSRDDGWRLISRADVFNRAEDPLDLFVAAMAWGFGNRGYGGRRPSDIINAARAAGGAHAGDCLRPAAAEAGAGGGLGAGARGGGGEVRGPDTAVAGQRADFA